MKKTILILALCSAVLTSAKAQQHTMLSAEFDKVLKEELPLTETGATVLVSRRGKVIYKKAVGTANAELSVPMQTNHVFRIASLTKQFTAIAILQLMEAGKLNLQDEITRFFPDYPVQGAKITIEHLLTHTSGIRDYTTIGDSLQQSRIDISPVEMIRHFQHQAMRFAPGTRYEYSNSNYFLLGYIIEKIAGKTYQQYLEDNFFRPLGMSNSSYASDTQMIRNRAAGYTRGEKGLENAAVISMTRPYAAGAILSTVQDLFKWNQAVQSYQLVSRESLEKAFTRYKLANGKETAYGYGYRFGFIRESRSIWHGGLINGFMSMAMYLPKEDVYVAVLSNCNCVSPERVTAKLAAVAIGQPYSFKELAIQSSDVQNYKGVYENEGGDQLVISDADGKLYLQRRNGPKVRIKAFGKDRFFFEDQLMTMNFSVAERGEAEKLTIQSRNGSEVWKKSKKPLVAQAEVTVDDKVLDLYTGEYEVTPQFSFTISKEKGQLYLQGKGQEKLQLFAEADHKFFLKVNDARLEFVSEGQKVTKAILSQGGRTTEAMKIK